MFTLPMMSCWFTMLPPDPLKTFPWHIQQVFKSVPDLLTGWGGLETRGQHEKQQIHPRADPEELFQPFEQPKHGEARGSCILTDTSTVSIARQHDSQEQSLPVIFPNTVSLLLTDKRIYRLPVFTEEFCKAFVDELENFEQSDMPKGRPNTMNNYGVGLTSSRASLGGAFTSRLCLSPGFPLLSLPNCL